MREESLFRGEIFLAIVLDIDQLTKILQLVGTPGEDFILKISSEHVNVRLCDLSAF